jgi:hypothetical protein
MKRILICTGVLGGGTALVFAAAALAATLAPAGALVPGNFQQAQMFGGIRGGGPLLVGNGGPITKVIGPDGTVTLQNGPINNFGVIGAGNTSVNVATGVNIGIDLPAVAPGPAATPPVIVQPVGSEAP